MQEYATPTPHVLFSLSLMADALCLCGKSDPPVTLISIPNRAELLKPRMPVPVSYSLHPGLKRRMRTSPRETSSSRVVQRPAAQTPTTTKLQSTLNRSQFRALPHLAGDSRWFGLAFLRNSRQSYRQGDTSESGEGCKIPLRQRHLRQPRRDI